MLKKKFFSHINKIKSIATWKKDLALAKKFFKENDYEQSIKFFTFSLKGNSDNTDAFWWRGVSILKLSDNDFTKARKAVKDFSQVINKKPKSEAYVNRSAAYIILKEYEKSIYDCDKAIKLKRKDSKAFFNRAISYSYLGKYKKAKIDFTRDIKLNVASEHDSFLQRGLIQQKLGNYELAIKDFKKVQEFKKINSFDLLLATQKCSLNYIKVGKYKYAIEESKMGISTLNISNNSNTSLEELSPWMTYICYSNMKINNLKEAIIWSNKLVMEAGKIWPGKKSAHLHLESLILRGYILTKLKNYDRALEDFKKAKEIDEKHFTKRYINMFGLNIENLIYVLPEEMKNILMITFNLSIN